MIYKKIVSFIFVVLVLSSSRLAWAIKPETHILPDMLKHRLYAAAYKKMLEFPNWVKMGEGPSTEVSEVVIQDKNYWLGHLCKAHDCSDQQLEVILDKEGKQAWGLLSVRTKNDASFIQSYLGVPSPPFQEVLQNSFSVNNPRDENRN